MTDQVKKENSLIVVLLKVFVFILLIPMAGAWAVLAYDNHRNEKYMASPACQRMTKTTIMTTTTGETFSHNVIGGYKCEDGRLFYDDGHWSNWK